MEGRQVKFLILGCNGMLGHMLTLYLLNQKHHVTGFAREKSPFVDTIVSDIHNLDLLKSAVIDYDIIVNCIGLLNQYAENNQSEAVFINSYLPHILVDFTKGTSTKIIQISTDCVFSGAGGGTMNMI